MGFRFGARNACPIWVNFQYRFRGPLLGGFPVPGLVPDPDAQIGKNLTSFSRKCRTSLLGVVHQFFQKACTRNGRRRSKFWWPNVAHRPKMLIFHYVFNHFERSCQEPCRQGVRKKCGRRHRKLDESVMNNRRRRRSFFQKTLKVQADVEARRQGGLAIGVVPMISKPDSRPLNAAEGR